MQDAAGYSKGALFFRTIMRFSTTFWHDYAASCIYLSKPILHYNLCLSRVTLKQNENSDCRRRSYQS
jgi:hypothetical protein